MSGDFKERNAAWAKELTERLYPLSHRDIGDVIGYSREHVCNVLNNKVHIDPDTYERLKSIDVQLVLDQFPDIRAKTEKRLRKVYDEAPRATAALEEYF